MTEKQEPSDDAAKCDVCGEIGAYPITVEADNRNTICTIEHLCAEHLPIDDESADALYTTKQMDRYE